jgi:hypothetical protein
VIDDHSLGGLAVTRTRAAGVPAARADAGASAVVTLWSRTSGTGAIVVDCDDRGDQHRETPPQRSAGPKNRGTVSAASGVCNVGPGHPPRNVGFVTKVVDLLASQICVLFAAQHSFHLRVGSA